MNSHCIFSRLAFIVSLGVGAIVDSKRGPLYSPNGLMIWQAAHAKAPSIFLTEKSASAYTTGNRIGALHFHLITTQMSY